MFSCNKTFDTKCFIKFKMPWPELLDHPKHNCYMLHHAPEKRRSHVWKNVLLCVLFMTKIYGFLIYQLCSVFLITESK
jgi:hypothetical protein